MRILYVSFLHPDMQPGGAQQIAYEMFAAAKNAGFSATFIAAVPLQLLPAAIKKTNGGIFKISGREQEYLFVPEAYKFDHFSVTSAKSVAALLSFIEQNEPDVVHFHHYHCVGLEILGLAKQRLPKCRLIMHLHEMLAICWREGQMIHGDGQICSSSSPMKCANCNAGKDANFFSARKDVILHAFDQVDQFVVPSAYLRRLYVDWGLAPDRVSVVANGLRRPAGADRLPVSEALNSFGFFGQLLDAKGLRVIWQAIEILVTKELRPPLRIEINGGNLHFASRTCRDEAVAMQEKVPALARCGIEFVFRGVYSRSQLAERMRSVDWVLVPSIWGETFALVLSEAWMFGRVPIVSNVGAMADRVHHNVDGLQFPVGDASALAATVCEAAGNRELHRRLRAAAPSLPSDTDMLAAHMAIYRGQC
jgi:glycosyltransferase involved in cell wall biosynthesis